MFIHLKCNICTGRSNGAYYLQVRERATSPTIFFLFVNRSFRVDFFFNVFCHLDDNLFYSLYDFRCCISCGQDVFVIDQWYRIANTIVMLGGKSSMPQTDQLGSLAGES